MYVEFVEGKKYSFNEADISDNHDSFTDAGWVLGDDEIVVDIDCLSREVIEKLITVFKIKTQTVWTDKGVHFYFKKPSGFRGAKRVCALGFEVEFKHIKNTKAVTIKRNGVLRAIDNLGTRCDMPDIFAVNKRFESLLGLDEGDGRNNKLFAHRGLLGGVRGWKEMLRFVNNNVFATPLDEDEFGLIVRDMSIKAGANNEPEIAEWLMNELNVVYFNGLLYFRNSSEYVSDTGLLRREIIQRIGAQKTRYIDEVIKQMEYRASIVKEPNVGFDIKFNNGILRDGKFYEIDYEGFTPYTIDVNYYADAEPIKAVDDYIDHLTGGEGEYRALLGEILGHTLITNKEFKRMVGKFFIFVGDGGNGKGTLLEIIKSILKAKNCSALSIKNMKDERYLPSMIGKLANLGDDIHDIPIKDDELKNLKNISTCDFVETRELYKQSKALQLSLTLIFTSNHILKSFEKGGSFKRRILWLPMYTVVADSKKDPRFITRMTSDDALEYWVRLVVEGYQRLYKNGSFTISPKVGEFNEEYHIENNSCLMWLEDCEYEDIEGKKPKEIYDEYALWAEEEDLGVASKKMLINAIQSVFGLRAKPVKIAGKTTRVFAKMGEKNET